MTTLDTTEKESPTSTVRIDCEGIRTTGQYCDQTISLEFPRMPEGGRTMTAAQRKARARKIAAEKGWRAPKGFDECPRIHGFMPTKREAVIVK